MLTHTSGHRQYQKYILRLCLGFLPLMVLVYCAPRPIWASPIAEHKSSIFPLWTQSDVYSRQNPQPLIVSSVERIFLLGSNNRFSESHLIALDSKNGSLLWENDTQKSQSLIAVQSEIIIGGVGEVFAVDGINGKILWNTPLPASRSVTTMYATDDEILVDTVSLRYFVLSRSSGEVLQTVDYDTNNPPYWKSIPYGAYWQAPIYRNHYLYGRTGQRFGYAFAIDLDNSTELWRTNENIISNVSVTSSHAYVLAEDGKLIEIELNTGQQKVIVEFDSTPFQILSTPSGGHVYSYYVAANSDEQIIYVLLGDSAQLFAFSLSP